MVGNSQPEPLHVPGGERSRPRDHLSRIQPNNSLEMGGFAHGRHSETGNAVPALCAVVAGPRPLPA